MSLTEDVLATIIFMFFAAAKCGGDLHQGKTTTQNSQSSAISKINTKFWRKVSVTSYNLFGFPWLTHCNENPISIVLF